MCGATSEQKELQREQMDFYKQGNERAATAFAEDQAILTQMQQIYAPILAKGPNQRGFSDEERNSLDAQTIDGTADNYARASRAVNEEMAAKGGGSAMPTGAEIQLKQDVASSAAKEESRQQAQIIAADWAQGHKQFGEATDALMTASGHLNPTAYQNSATEAGGAASKTANDIAVASNSWVNAAIGAAGALGGAVVSENPGGIFGG
jgi:hypothetical protein